VRTESITDDLRRDLLAGHFPPGERLVELLLTERYGCGRAAVRSALVELASEGLVDREANRGATVRRISIDEAIEITEARAALEGLMAAAAARMASPSENQQLLNLIAEMDGTVGTAGADRDSGVEFDHVRYSELNRTLHRLIRRISQHTIAAHLVENLQNRATHHRYRLSLMPGRAAESIEQHRAIVAAITAGDGAAASAAMEAHLESVIGVMRRWGDAASG
jgi:DNA-binding GntR family transcriptional regulator